MEVEICTIATVLLLGWAAIGASFKAWNRLMRHLNIRSQGWPPAHCDADGDAVEDDAEVK